MTLTQMKTELETVEKESAELREQAEAVHGELAAIREKRVELLRKVAKGHSDRLTRERLDKLTSQVQPLEERLEGLSILIGDLEEREQELLSALAAAEEERGRQQQYYMTRRASEHKQALRDGIPERMALIREAYLRFAALVGEALVDDIICSEVGDALYRLFPEMVALIEQEGHTQLPAPLHSHGRVIAPLILHDPALSRCENPLNVARIRIKRKEQEWLNEFLQEVAA